MTSLIPVMTFPETLLFVATSLGFTLIPGPNATLIVATSITHNTKKGIQCALGVSSGIAIHLIIALFSTQVFLNTLMASIDWTIWMLTLVIIYFCVRWLFSRFKSTQRPNLSGAMSYAKGLGISLSNPKGIIFFAALVPPFINKQQAYWPQALTLSSIFLCIALLGDLIYAVFAGEFSRLAHAKSLRKFLKKHRSLAKLRLKGWLSRW